MRQNSYRYTHPSEAYFVSPEVSLRDTQVNWVAPYFKNGDLALTLTCRESINQYSANYKPNLIAFNKTVKHFLNLVNREFLGRNKSRKNQLRVVFTYELNTSHGLHTHMILQELPTDRVPKHEHISVLSRIWANMLETGCMSGTRVEEVYDVQNWVKYMFKDLHNHNSEYYDPTHWHLTK